MSLRSGLRGIGSHLAYMDGNRQTSRKRPHDKYLMLLSRDIGSKSALSDLTQCDVAYADDTTFLPGTCTYGYRCGMCWRSTDGSCPGARLFRKQNLSKIRDFGGPSSQRRNKPCTPTRERHVDQSGCSLASRWYHSLYRTLNSTSSLSLAIMETRYPHLT